VVDSPVTNTAFQSVRWSPDGEWLSYLVGNNDESTIWIANAHRFGNARPLVGHVRTQSDFEWSPDGHSMAVILRDAPAVLQIINVDDGRVSAAIQIGGVQFFEIRDIAWSPSGHSLALTARGAADFFDLLKIDLLSRITTM